MTTTARRVMLFFALVGLAAAVTALYVHYRLLTQPGYSSFCDVSATVSCTEVYQSRFGSLLGVPVALFGTGWFVLALILVLAAGGGPHSTK